MGSTRAREGGDLVVEALAARGVEHLFSVSGGPINSIYHAISRSSVQLCHVRHEAAAGFMADAVYRVSHRPGVAVVTLGPGATNTVTSVATAARAGVPMLVIGGQASTRLLDRDAGMQLDTLPVFTPVTKWAARVLHTDRIPEYIDEAWRRMLAPTPGPVYLEIPADVLGGTATAEVTWAEATYALPSVGAAVARQAMAAAQRLLVIVGDDVFHSDSAAAVARFVESSGAAFATLRLARGAIDEDHDLFIGPAYTAANPGLRRALAEADAVLLLGHHWEFDLDFGSGVGPQATVVQVHPDASLLGRHRPVQHAICATVHAFLSSGPELDIGSRDKGWVAELNAAWHDYRRTAAGQPDPDPIHPAALADEVARVAPRDTLFVTSHGNVDFWADSQLVIHRPASYLRAGQAGTLGAEIPYGIAAKLTRPHDPVVVFVGDGGFAYHGLELETALRYNAPVVVVVADDQRWGAIAIPQGREYGVEVEMDLPRRDWAGMARSLGCHGEYVRTSAEVGPAMTRALAAGVPAVVQVAVSSVLSPYMSYISG